MSYVFDELPITTVTVMAYTNMDIDIEKFYKDTVPYNIELQDRPCNKKGVVIKRQIKAPKGTIWSMSFGEKQKGLVLPRKKKERRETGVKIDVTKKRIHHFRNNVMFELSGGTYTKNFMLFKNSFKLAGCKDIKETMEIIEIFWNYHLKNSGCWTVKEGTQPTIILEEVMKNRKYKFDFNIDRDGLHYLMNEPEYAQYVNKSRYDTTNSTNVKIEMPTVVPKDYKMHKLVCGGGQGNKVSEGWTLTETNPYNVKKRKLKPTTFIVFSSGQVKISGRYDAWIETLLKFFVDTVIEHRADVEEKIREI